MKHVWLVGIAALVGCKSDASKKPEPAEKPTAVATEPKAAMPDKAVEATAAEIAARPRVTVALEKLGLQLQVPEGTKELTVGSARPGSAHLETGKGEFMVNIDAVDKYSLQSFAEAQKVYEKDTLIEWYTKEETPTGWVTYKLVDSELHKRRSFEVNVRTKVGGKAWNCEVAAPSKIYGDIALEACKSLDVAGSTPTGTGPEGPAIGTAKPAKPAATKATAAAATPTKPDTAKAAAASAPNQPAFD